MSFFSPIRADGDAANAEAAEKNGGGVELRDGTGKAADATDSAVLVHHFEQLGKERAADVVDGQVNSLLELLLHMRDPLIIGGIEDFVGSELAKLFSFFFAARHGEDVIPIPYRVAHRRRQRHRRRR